MMVAPRRERIQRSLTVSPGASFTAVGVSCPSNARFVLRAFEGHDTPTAVNEAPGDTVSERWIRSRLGATIIAVDAAFRDYRFDFAASALYEFTWHEFCEDRKSVV